MKLPIDEIQIPDIYERIYDERDISELINALTEDKNDYTPIVVDTNNNVIAGIDTVRAFAQLHNDGAKGFGKIKATKCNCSNDDEVIVEIIKHYDHRDCSKEELCKAVYVYYESYRKAYPKGHDMYLTGKQLLPYLPNIFSIKKDDSNSLLCAKCYEDYILVGRKMWELEEQGRIDDLECLYILLNNISVSTIRRNGFVNQIDLWSDKEREEIRKQYSCKGEFYRRIHRISQRCTTISENDSSTQEAKTLQDYIDDLHDEERDRSLNDIDLARLSIDNIRSAILSVSNTIEEESKPKITIQSKQIACQLLDEIKQFANYINDYFEL